MSLFLILKPELKLKIILLGNDFLYSNNGKIEYDQMSRKVQVTLNKKLLACTSSSNKIQANLVNISDDHHSTSCDPLPASPYMLESGHSQAAELPPPARTKPNLSLIYSISTQIMNMTTLMHLFFNVERKKLCSSTFNIRAKLYKGFCPAPP